MNILCSQVKRLYYFYEFFTDLKLNFEGSGLLLEIHSHINEVNFCGKAISNM